VQRAGRPRWKLESSLVRRPCVHRFAVRDDHSLERKVEQAPQSAHRPPVVVAHRPRAQHAVPFRERVGEYDDALFGEPQWRLVEAARVVEDDDAWK
jgi:hypothetical protein